MSVSKLIFQDPRFTPLAKLVLVVTADLNLGWVPVVYMASLIGETVEDVQAATKLLIDNGVDFIHPPLPAAN